MAPLIIVRHGENRYPKWKCLVCGNPFFEDEGRSKFERHVIDCAARHEEELRAESWAVKAPGLFGPDAGDVEFEAWVKRNARAILEGRLRMK